ncbi:serine/arginine repetitive matrix protein 1 isoform X2 [Patella vulgata]|uniref:serine/arginine repetitive matrix protein 1 isoform X2 n=1 Tax=Patella vulgata TaxID=6465 RepID=UPI0021802EC1|nr:serine/arginine repetitive matrix protein 1 isoform X2 [Patella vulgata]
MAARPAPQQNQPLPPGYEARWDPGQNAYFFINHYTKTTTWTDPRLTQHAGAKQALNQPEPSKPQEREAIPLSDIRHTGRGGTSHHYRKKETQFIEADSVHVNKLRNMFPDCSADLIKSTLVKYHNNFEVTKSTLINNGYRCLGSSAVNIHVNDDITLRLQRKFPEASHLIPDVLTACGNSENDAARQLKDLGFGSDRHRSPSPKPQSHTPLSPSATASSPSRHASPRRAASPARQPSPVRQPDPEPVRVSEAEKERLKRKLNAEFSHIGDYLVSMALEACEYNEDSTRAVLDTGIEDIGSESSRPSTTESTTRPSTSHSTVSSASTSRTITSPVPLATNDLEPVAFTMDDDNMPMKPGSATSRETTQSERSPVKKQQQKAKHVTKNRTPKPVAGFAKGPVVSQPRSRTHVTPKPTRSIVTQRQTGQVYESIYRTQPMGPDPTLRSGPDPSLRGVREQLANGPDPNMRQGPDTERRMGPQGWNGPDPSLRCGPMKVVTNNRVLVSSI